MAESESSPIQTPEGGTYVNDMQLSRRYCSITRYWLHNGATEGISLQFVNRREYNAFIKDLGKWAKGQDWS